MVCFTCSQSFRASGLMEKGRSFLIAPDAAPAPGRVCGAGATARGVPKPIGSRLPPPRLCQADGTSGHDYSGPRRWRGRCGSRTRSPRDASSKRPRPARVGRPAAEGAGQGPGRYALRFQIDGPIQVVQCAVELAHFRVDLPGPAESCKRRRLARSPGACCNRRGPPRDAPYTSRPWRGRT